MFNQRRIGIVLVLFVAVVISWAGPNTKIALASSVVPSLEITGGIANSCDSSNYDLPIFYNLTDGSSTTSLKTVPGVGSFTFSENESNNFGPGTYGIGNEPYSVSPHTPITETITTYKGPDQSGGVSFVSTVVFDCTTGAVLSLTNSAGGSGGSNGVTWFTPGDGRLNGQPGDRLVVYCNASAKPATIDLWLVDNSSIGHELTKINLSDLTAVPTGTFSKNLGANGVVFAGSDASGNAYAALQGGPFGATAQGVWLKAFACKASS